ncbi:MULTISPECIES: DUF58 domain-containing protein [Halocynthiibacter]|uniref:DUF58 domain-containing protein n=1 Tax=Halocynthiibacter halioticoli TaxID=2986804 RepID=A0AAE3LUK4_9RHOB|nr:MULTISPECIES: DUF58 domain-containing protein [Halocynthiibacter]MCV6824520.1 DUF58 domain-containing protein [Halocynthiibacter halioticoli]MCW4057521.1 DUF58 domain-containing protein [Halocynthiibacter sp. SDUM655004]
MFDKAALIRTGLAPQSPAPDKSLDPRVSVDLAHLRKLEPRAKTLSFLPRQPANSALNGRHASRMRGRGLNFEELRDYLPNDDIRAIDWKVTARTGKPHVRVFTEERDRPTLIVVDQRMSMFFGSVLNMKSVTAAECAALAAFRILDQGDRVGGIVFGDETIAEIRPQRSRRALDRFLASLAAANAQLHAEAPNVTPVSLDDVLTAVARIAPRNHLILIFSDFDVISETTRKRIRGISQHNDLVLGLVSDPMADDMPPDLRLAISDGRLQAEIDTGDQTVQRSLRDMAKGRLADVLDWKRSLGVPILPLSAGEDSLSQMRRLMGLGPR